jgi:hypothetical protein
MSRTFPSRAVDLADFQETAKELVTGKLLNQSGTSKQICGEQFSRQAPDPVAMTLFQCLPDLKNRSFRRLIHQAQT